MYKIEAGIWQDGSGWQPHDIETRYAGTVEDAHKKAAFLSVLCAHEPLGYPVITITNTKTGETIAEY